MFERDPCVSFVKMQILFLFYSVHLIRFPPLQWKNPKKSTSSERKTLKSSEIMSLNLNFCLKASRKAENYLANSNFMFNLVRFMVGSVLLVADSWSTKTDENINSLLKNKPPWKRNFRTDNSSKEAFTSHLFAALFKEIQAWRGRKKWK